MNYKIAKTMLGLCIGYLSVFYILKFFFPQILVQTISHPTLIRLGEVFAQHQWTVIIFQIITSSIAFYLFACAGSGRFKFSKFELIGLGILVGLNNIIYYLIPSLYTHTCTSLLFISALIVKGKLKYATISFVIHGYLTQFLTTIRGFDTVIMYINPISGFMLSTEANVWLLLLSIIFYFKEKKYGSLGSPLCEQARGNSREEA
jgi:hypothetical protein